MLRAHTNQEEVIVALRALSLPSERAAYVASMSDPESALVDVAASCAAAVAEDAPRALESLQLLTEIADDMELPRARTQLRRTASRMLAYVGRFDESIALARSAMAIAEASQDWVEAGRARLASMHGLCELGQLEEAVSIGTEARQLLERAGDPSMVARADINLGIAHYRNDHPNLAVDCFDRARGPLQSEPVVLASLENSRGEALLALNDFQGAADAFAAARNRFEQHHQMLNAAIAEGNLADLAYRRGRLEEALELFERARRRLVADDLAVHRVRLLSEQAEAKANLGLWQEATAEYERVIPALDRHGLALEAARARAGLGRVLLRAHRVDEAATLLSAAATQYEELGHHSARARIDLTRAQLLTAMGHAAQAQKLVDRAAAVLRDRPIDFATARHVAATIAMRLGQFELADAEAKAGLAIIRDAGLTTLEADLLSVRGNALEMLDEHDEAVAALRDAIRLIERVRGMLQADRFRAAFLGDRTRPYEDLTRLLIASKTSAAEAEAFAIVEKAKSRTLLEHMRGVFDTSTTITSPIVAEDRHAQQIERELVTCQEKLNVLYSRVADGTAGLDIRREMHETEKELQLLDSRLGAIRGVAQLRAPTQSLHNVQQMLAADEVLIEYFSTGDRIGAFVVHAEHLRIHGDLCSLESVVEGIRQIEFQMNRSMRPGQLSPARAGRLREDVLHALSVLHDLVMRPLEIPPDTSRLIIIPHGPLHVAPFSALWDGHAHAIERWEITAAPSASVWAELSRSERRTTGDCIVFGCGDEIAASIESEAGAVAAMVGARSFIGSAATTEALRSNAPDGRILHIAAHGRFAVDGSQGSGFRLADRWMTLRDICQLDLDADLVVLSGCETGLSGVACGDELSGLIRSFLSAGARSVIGSLWRVDDVVTTAFMHELYNQISPDKESTSAVSSLIRAIQTVMIQEGQHPACWSPFFLVGR